MLAKNFFEAWGQSVNALGVVIGYVLPWIIAILVIAMIIGGLIVLDEKYDNDGKKKDASL